MTQEVVAEVRAMLVTHLSQNQGIPYPCLRAWMAFVHSSIASALTCKHFFHTGRQRDALTSVHMGWAYSVAVLSALTLCLMALGCNCLLSIYIPFT